MVGTICGPVQRSEGGKSSGTLPLYSTYGFSITLIQVIFATEEDRELTCSLKNIERRSFYPLAFYAILLTANVPLVPNN